ncbi:MAG TPA: CAP domain-containing protein [Candidatus Paceibacterota bacterium]|nr:CAP domain-containing protein [Candidatus Paceibacterota bacterium]
MISWIARHFLPHEGNGHRPHLLHGETSRYAVLFLLMVETAVFFGMTSHFIGGLGSTAAVLPSVLGDLTNVERAKESLGSLSDNPVLDESARLKAEDMAAKGYFAHVSPEGREPWYWLEQVGYDYEYAGENLAINFSDSEDVTNAWMNSPTHRANIEKAQYTEMGTGIATGTFDGVSTVFVVQVYAKPTPHPEPVVAVAEPVKPEESYQAPAEEVVEATSTEQVLGASVAAAPAPSVAAPTIFQRMEASPRHTGNLIFLIVSVVVSAVMVLTIAVQAFKGKLNHYDLLTNTILVIAVAGALALANYYLSTRIYPTETSFAGFDSAHTLTK